jgi:hypothetical protein
MRLAASTLQDSFRRISRIRLASLCVAERDELARSLARIVRKDDGSGLSSFTIVKTSALI